MMRLLVRRFPVLDPSASAVLVTGVSGGLGQACAHALADRGFLVFGTVRKEEDANQLRASGGIVPLLLDVNDPAQYEAAMGELARMLQQHGRTLGALINNAGITGMDRTRTLDFAGAEHYERVLGTNVVGLVRATEAVLPLLKQARGARVVNLGSYFGDLCPSKAMTAQYVASKHAVEGLTDVWRRSLAAEGVAVALIKPGDFATRMNPTPTASKDLAPVVESVCDAVLSDKPLPRYYIGQWRGIPVAVLCRLLNVLPDAVVDRLFRAAGV
jgi:NAD(P)-dependent dehydrogenase (short-subunit alcohol dehydrogenase family)